MSTKFFVHIPKTAGTSFRLGAENYLGDSNIFYDYGEHSEVTSAQVRKHIYSNNDFWGFYRSCTRRHVKLVGGHVNAARFVSGFGVNHLVTFLREPLQRMISEYFHFSRHHGFKGNFSDFYSRPVMHNRLSKVLKGVPLEAIGFTGLTERYDESLAMINSMFDWNISPLQKNVGKESIHAPHEISDNDIRVLKDLNQRDILLYERSIALFEQRLQMFKSGKPFAYAQLSEIRPKRVMGWAWWENADDKPVEVEVYLNGELRMTGIARDLRQGLCWLRPPRGGYVGFSVPLTAQPGDTVQCRVSETGQWFPQQAIKVPET